VRGLLALVDDLPELEEPARRACGYLRSLFDEEGRVWLLPEWDPAAWRDQLSVLSVLRKAEKHWSEPAYGVPDGRGVEILLHEGPVPACPALGLYSAGCCGAVLEAELAMEVGRPELAAELMERVGSHQKGDGSLVEFPLWPGEYPGKEYPWSNTVAHAAWLWYRVGDRQRGDRAMRFLEGRQERDGVLASPLHQWEPAGAPWDAWAVKYYLDAALLRVRAAFEERWEEFPERIDQDDSRMRAVFDWFETLPPDACVADVGCGKGRFLRHAVERFGGVRFVGIDISPAMLDRLPDGVERRIGSILRIPAAEGEFEGAFAVESLEHALVPERAIAELCRVV